MTIMLIVPKDDEFVNPAVKNTVTPRIAQNLHIIFIQLR